MRFFIMKLNTLVCTAFIAVLAAALCAPIHGSEVRKLNRKANKLYEQGKYEDALKLYEDALLLDPSDNKLKMNRGSALYRLGNKEEAENSYVGSLSQTDKKTLADAHYNLGNILYSQGEKLMEEGEISTAKEKYTQALQNYIETLKLRPNDKDAKWNLQLAHQKVNMLENTECQNQNNNENNDKNENDENQQNQQNDKNENNENQDENDKNQQQQEQDKNDGQNEEQNEQNAQEQEQSEDDLKKDEAARLIELYADDADSLSKPKQNRRVRQPEKDW